VCRCTVRGAQNAQFFLTLVPSYHTDVGLIAAFSAGAIQDGRACCLCARLSQLGGSGRGFGEGAKCSQGAAGARGGNSGRPAR
jgi:hypothetical protein